MKVIRSAWAPARVKRKRPKLVAESVDGKNESWLLWIILNFLAQATYMHIDGPSWKWIFSEVPCKKVEARRQKNGISGEKVSTTKSKK